MTRKQILGTIAAIAVTALCLRFILTAAMVRTLREVLPQVHPAPLVAVLILTVAINLVRGARFSLALGTGERAAGPRMFRICALLVFLNYMLPFKMGEFSFPVLVKRSFDTGYATSIGVLVYSRVMDLLAVLAIGGFVLTAVWHEQASSLDRFALPIAVAASVGLVLMPFVLVKMHDLGQRLTQRASLLALMERLFQGCRAVAAPRRHATYLALTLAVWGLQAACAFLTMVAMGVAASPLDGVLASAAASVTFALPVSGVAGIGPMQASWAYALTVVGWPWEMAVANAFLAHGTLVLSSALLSLVAVIFVREPPAGRAVAAP